MNIVTVDAAFVTAKLNSLPPHSRLRSGYCDLMRHIQRKQIEADVARMRESDGDTAMLADALSEALAEGV